MKSLSTACSHIWMLCQCSLCRMKIRFSRCFPQSQSVAFSLSITLLYTMNKKYLDDLHTFSSKSNWFDIEICFDIIFAFKSASQASAYTSCSFTRTLLRYETSVPTTSLTTKKSDNMPHTSLSLRSSSCISKHSEGSSLPFLPCNSLISSYENDFEVQHHLYHKRTNGTYCKRK
jgi:hypothetical protein